MTLLGLLLAIVGALLALLKKIDWQNLFANARSKAASFDKEKAANFLKNHKKAILIGAIVFFAIIMIADNLFYRPVISGGNTYSSGGYYSHSNPNRPGLCPACRGSTDCSICNGTGYYSNYGIRSECSACNKTGDCSICDGTGLK